jgi:protein-tyrosine sulfotransferase
MTCLIFKTVVLPQVLKFNKRLQSTEKFINLTGESGITDEKIKNAVRLYVYSIMSEHMRRAERLCAKDPTILRHMEYLHALFPQAKFVYLVRDPRAQVVSYLKYVNQPLTDKSKQSYLIEWNAFNNEAFTQCVNVGKRRCLIVNYESLVMNTRSAMERVARFLDVSWTDDFLHHEDFVGSRVIASRAEWSSNQIKKPVYTDRLVNWKRAGGFEIEMLNETAPMYRKFGYDINVEHHGYLKEV